MSSPVLGAGFAPAGLCYCGFGSPAIADSTVSKLWIQADGSQGNCSAIDNNTGDVMYDQFGNEIGGRSVQQMLYLALETNFNSSCVLNFGLNLSSIKTVTPNIQMQIQFVLAQCLSNLTSKNLIRIDNVSVSNIDGDPTSLSVILNWTDLTSNEQNAYKLLG